MASGHMKSLMRTGLYCPLWGMLTNSTGDLPSAARKRGVCTLLVQAICLQESLLWGPLDSMGGRHHDYYLDQMAKNSQPLALICSTLPSHSFFISFLCFLFLFFLILESPSSPVICFPSVHADGATKRSQEVWCTQIPLDSVCSLYHRAVGERNEKLEAIF